MNETTKETILLLLSHMSDERLARYILRASAAVAKEAEAGRTNPLSLEQCDRYEIELRMFVQLYVLALREQAKRKEARA